MDKFYAPLNVTEGKESHYLNRFYSFDITGLILA